MASAVEDEPMASTQALFWCSCVPFALSSESAIRQLKLFVLERPERLEVAYTQGRPLREHRWQAGFSRVHLTLDAEQSSQLSFSFCVWLGSSRVEVVLRGEARGDSMALVYGKQQHRSVLWRCRG